MEDFLGRVITGVLSIIFYECLHSLRDKMFFKRTRFLEYACEKQLGVKCVSGRLTVNGMVQCVIIPEEKYTHALFSMEAVRKLCKLPSSELRKVISNAFVEKETVA